MPIPYLGRESTFHDSDGAEVPVRLWGNQFAAVVETRDGYTIVKDPATGDFHYARLSADGSSLVPSGSRVGSADPGTLGVPRHLRLPAETAKRLAARARAERGQFRWERRRAERAARQLEAAKGRAGVSQFIARGRCVGLCLLIDFPDERGTIGKAEVDNFCNQPGYRDFGNNGSVRDYFWDVSGGRLEYTNVVTEYYTAQHDEAYYTDPGITPGVRIQELIVEALTDIKAKGFDFDQVSVDEQGYVYALNVFYAGPAKNEWAQGLWPQMGWLDAPFAASSTRTFWDYQISCMGAGDELSLGTFCHENGHMLCMFPDLYDYGGESAGAGGYCLMSTGWNTNPVQPCAFLKNDAGWADQLRALEPDTEYTIAADANDFLMHRRNVREYFILENRQQTGRDADLPDAGLLIWHVDEQSGNNGNEQMLPEQHYLCSLEQADGRFDLEHGANGGDEDDLFGGPTEPSFGFATTPDSNWWDGSRSRLELAYISPPGPTMRLVSHDGRRIGSLAMMGDHSDHVYAFGVTTDDILGMSARGPDGTWSRWEFDWRGAPRLSAVAAAGDRSNCVFVFGIAPDGGVHHIWLTPQGEWSPWTADWNGAPKLRSIATVSDLGNRLYVFGLAEDGILHEVSRDARGSWSTWQASWRGAPKLRSVIPATDLNNQMYVFGIAQDDTLYMTWRDSQGRWSPWQANWNGAPKVHTITVVPDFGNQCFVFGVAADGTTFVTSRDTQSRWSSWEADWHSAPKLHSITALCDPRNRLYLFGVSSDETLFVTSRDGVGAWTGWTADWNGAPKVEAVVAAVAENNTMQVIGIATSGRTYLTTRDPNYGWRPWTADWQRV